MSWFAPVPGRDDESGAWDRVAVRRTWSGRIPSPFSGQLFPWPVFGTPCVAGCRSGIEFRREWRERRIPHRGPGAWPFPSFAACCGVLGLYALESGSAGFHTRGGFPASLPPLLVLAGPVASGPWAGRGFGRGLLPVGWLLFGLGFCGGLPAGHCGFLGLSLAFGLLEGEAVDKYLSFRLAHPDDTNIRPGGPSVPFDSSAGAFPAPWNTSAGVR